MRTIRFILLLTLVLAVIAPFGTFLSRDAVSLAAEGDTAVLVSADPNTPATGRASEARLMLLVGTALIGLSIAVRKAV
jgi:hypothetical protein